MPYVITIRPYSSWERSELCALAVRAIEIDGPDATPQVFLTSIPKTEISRTRLGRLYRLRWEVEEFYKPIPSDSLGQKPFHCLTRRACDRRSSPPRSSSP